MTRARSLSRLANSTVFTVSDTNRVGIGSTIPDVKLDVGEEPIIDDTTQTTSVSTGALVVSGGVGIGKSLFVGGDMSVAGTLTYEDVTNTETAGITTTGGLVVTGLGATFGSISTHFSNIEFGAAGVGGTITPLGHAEFVGVVTASSFSEMDLVSQELHQLRTISTLQLCTVYWTSWYCRLHFPYRRY